MIINQIIEHKRDISERYIDKLTPCKKCGSKPIIKSYFNTVSGDQDSYICCPNCDDNRIDFYDHLERVYPIWNEKQRINMKLNSVIDFSKWHTIAEMPKINTHILFCDEKGSNFYHGIILKKSGYMFFNSFMNNWNKIIKCCDIKYWIYMNEIDVKR